MKAFRIVEKRIYKVVAHSKEEAIWKVIHFPELVKRDIPNTEKGAVAWGWSTFKLAQTKKGRK